MQTIVRHASEADLRAVMEMLALKAEFDGCRDALVATEEQLRQAFFSSSPRAQVLLIPVVDVALLPLSLLDAFLRTKDPCHGWGHLLRFLSPLTIPGGPVIKIL